MELKAERSRKNRRVRSAQPTYKQICKSAERNHRGQIEVSLNGQINPTIFPRCFSAIIANSSEEISNLTRNLMGTLSLCSQGVIIAL